MLQSSIGVNIRNKATLNFGTIQFDMISNDMVWAGHLILPMMLSTVLNTLQAEDLQTVSF